MLRGAMLAVGLMTPARGIPMMFAVRSRDRVRFWTPKTALREGAGSCKRISMVFKQSDSFKLCVVAISLKRMGIAGEHMKEIGIVMVGRCRMPDLLSWPAPVAHSFALMVKHILVRDKDVLTPICASVEVAAGIIVGIVGGMDGMTVD